MTFIYADNTLDLDNFGKKKKKKKKPFNLEELDKELPDISSKVKEESAMEFDLNQEEAPVEVSNFSALIAISSIQIFDYIDFRCVLLNDKMSFIKIVKLNHIEY